MSKFNVRTPLIVLAMTAALAACGGDSGGVDVGSGAGGAPGGPAPAKSDIPASALSSVDGLIAFMNQLIDTGTNDTSDPVLLGDATLPVNDTI